MKRLADLLPGVVADLATHHTLNRSTTMIRVHVSHEISMQPQIFRDARDWETTEDGTLRLYGSQALLVAEFAPNSWTHVERVEAGAA
jgi:hypothetical protein